MKEGDSPQKRKYPRFKVSQRALVLVNQSQDGLPFHIVDLSKGGVAFRYLGQPLRCTEPLKINLYHESELIVENLSVKPVSDFCIQSNLFPLRRGSMCFEHLDPVQDAKINHFIEAFAV